MTLNALSNATWPGRCQTLMWPSSSSSLPFDDDHNRSNKKKNVRFYLDGAHTPQSLDATVEWFRSKSNSSSSSNGTGSGETDGGGSGSGGGDEKPQSSQSSPPVLPILVFNCSHERNPVELLELLLKHQSGFSRVYFAQSDTSRPSPIAKASAESFLKERGITIREELLSDEGKKTDDDSEGEIEGKMNTKTTTTTWQETLAIIWKHLLIQSTADTKSTSASALVSSSQTRDQDSSSIIRCNMTANEIVQEISLLVQQQQKRKDRGEDDDDDDDSKTTLPLQEVFVTGSLYLVGSFLTALGWTEESSPT
ncbi:hypothetical protein FRACYDRAFT_247318 [Fragilariopsis cylindrus CCMP1102]|uniref:Mur ligase C-terminal domain-containing protein n=1 Tax=Fragilariopsis cylindrus CCMP1102 TaxID=635003 RepID=A0A1E7EWI8_9STRA|nr:hypothetical protein FRACYDRAFT_247318 [Fragilariopsis cylindrus CCMP1102]|eukprot:OEU10331.1 hypothetical protein FRACYDRAFT_247318 [Fragilariopsis cylindrus CCMP1102]